MEATRVPLLALLLASLAACASDPWSSYHVSLHEAIADNTRESRLSHAAHLERIVAHSRRSGRNPPPGVLAELAYYRARLGDSSRTESLLARELELYPESARFLAMLRSLLADPDFETWPEAVE